MRRKEQVVTFSIIAVLLIAAAFYTLSVIKKERAIQVRNNPATQAFNVAEGTNPYTDLAGNSLNLDSHLGTVVVVNSWASWSPHSQTELPLLSTIADDYRDKEVRFLAINRSESKESAERFLRSIGVGESIELVLDTDDKFYTSIAGYAMPETVVYDKKGNVVYHARGVVDTEILRTYIQSALEIPSTR